MYHRIDQHSIADMVDTFYTAVRQDELLGPVFARAIGADWTMHLEKMKAFWSSVLLASRTYKGNPMIAHLQLPRLTVSHFDRWLELWREVAGNLCSEEIASIFVQRAEAIGERLLHTISIYYGPANAQTPKGAQPAI